MKRLTKEQAIILSAYTGIALLDDLDEMYDYIEKKVGRPIFNIEMTFDGVQKEIKSKTLDDLEKIRYKTPKAKPKKKKE